MSAAQPPRRPSTSELRQALARLHQLLAGTPQLEASSQRLLRELLQDIERVLSRSAATAAPRPPEAQSRLQSLAVGFEADHPALAAGLREFVDLLGRAGL